MNIQIGKWERVLCLIPHKLIENPCLSIAEVVWLPMGVGSSRVNLLRHSAALPVYVCDTAWWQNVSNTLVQGIKPCATKQGAPVDLHEDLPTELQVGFSPRI